MNEKDQIIHKLKELSDDVYFRNDEDSIREITSAVLDYSFKGLALSAPRVITVDTQHTLPALLITGQSELRSAQVPLSENAIVISTYVDYGKVVAGEAFPGDPSKSPGDEPEPNQTTDEPGNVEQPSILPEDAALLEELGAGDTVGSVWLDFRELLGLPWYPAKLVLRVISFDEVSNPVHVELTSKDVTMEPFSGDTALEIARRAVEAVKTGEGPRFERSGKTPVLDSEGVALALSANKVTEGTKPMVIHGALKLQLSPQVIVTQSRDSEKLNGTGNLDLPAAVIKATLLITVRNSNRPACIEVDIPIWSDKELHPGEVVDAAFSLDLADMLPMELVRNTYCVYLFGGPYLSGPHKLVIE